MALNGEMAIFRVIFTEFGNSSKGTGVVICVSAVLCYSYRFVYSSVKSN